MFEGAGEAMHELLSFGSASNQELEIVEIDDRTYDDELSNGRLQVGSSQVFGLEERLHPHEYNPPYRIWPKLKSQPILRKDVSEFRKKLCDKDIQLVEHNRFIAIRKIDRTFLEELIGHLERVYEQDVLSKYTKEHQISCLGVVSTTGIQKKI